MKPKQVSKFEINHYEYFTYKDSKPNKKERQYSLNIEALGETEYFAIFSKPLTECFFHLSEFRTMLSAKLPLAGFQYKVIEENEIIISKKNEITEQLKKIQESQFGNMDKEKKDHLLSTIKDLLEDEDFLDKELKREITLIHEFDDFEFEMDVVSVNDNQEEEFDMEELNKEIEEINNDDELDERGKQMMIDLLTKPDWGSMKEVWVAKTQTIDEHSFLYDYLRGIDVISSNQRADFNRIIQNFLQNKLDISKEEHVTLNRDQRQLSKIGSRLIYLMKERKTISNLIHKISKIEIVKV